MNFLYTFLSASIINQFECNNNKFDKFICRNGDIGAFKYAVVQDRALSHALQFSTPIAKAINTVATNYSCSSVVMSRLQKLISINTQVCSRLHQLSSNFDAKT